MQMTDCFSSQFYFTSAATGCPCDDTLPSLPLHATILHSRHASNLCAQLKANSASADSAVVILQVPLAAAPAQQPASNSSLPPGISCQGSGSDQVCASRAVRLSVPECKSLALCQTSHA